MEKFKSEKAITLVALIITIIVLLILAVVTIAAVRDGGIIGYAQNARTEYQDKAAEENTTLQNYLDVLEANDPDAGKDENPKDEPEYTYGVNDPALNHSGTIPEGGTYVRKIYEQTTDYDEFGDPIEGEIVLKETVTYEAGDAFPTLSSTDENVDTYYYGDYIYTYQPGDGSWFVTVADKTKTSYGPILESINGERNKFLNSTFANCTALVTAPYIPYVVSMEGTFAGCINLTGDVEIDSIHFTTNFDTVFKDTVKSIRIIGNCTTEQKAALAASANNGNVTYE